jgi:DNA modification methylase
MLEITYQKVTDLIPYVNNSRTHSEEQVKQIAASIKEFGFTNPILIDENKGVIAGHGRLLAAGKLALAEVPTIVLEGLTEAQRKAYVIADNKLALNAGWDTTSLTAELERLKELDFDLNILGFDIDELNDLLKPDEIEGLTDEDDVPDAPENPVTVEGDVWILGRHRLMCGDSTSIDAVDYLINCDKIDLVHTDPPYGINEKGMRDDRGGLTTNSKVPDFKDDSIQYAINAFNICQSMNIPRQVWWGANYYSHAVPQTNNWFVWDKRVEDKFKDTQSDCELAYVKSKWSSVRIFRHVWKGMIKDSEHGQKRVHATQKPVALTEWVIDYYKDVSTVLDLFGGSGSTLMGCEKKGASCYMMELEPHYCDVIIKRWQDFTGQEAVHENGHTFNSISKNTDKVAAGQRQRKNNVRDYLPKGHRLNSVR